MKKRQCAARLLLRVPNGGARSACSTGAVSFPHCLRRRRRRVSTNEKETVRSTAAFASAERGRTPRVLHRRDPRPISRRIKRRRVSTNEKETVRSTAAFASAHRGRTLRVLHWANIPTPRRACTSAGIRKKIEQRHRRKAFLRVPIGGARPACSTVQAPRHAPCLHERRHKKKDRAAPSAQGVFASAHRGRTPRVLHRHCAVRARASIKRPDGAISRALKETRECCRNDIENQEQTTCLRWQSRTGDRSCAYAVKFRRVSLC